MHWNATLEEAERKGTLTVLPRPIVIEIDEKTSKYDFNKASEELRVLSTGLCLCSNATVDEGIYGDPTEIALVILAKNLGLTKKRA